MYAGHELLLFCSLILRVYNFAFIVCYSARKRATAVLYSVLQYSSTEGTRYAPSRPHARWAGTKGRASARRRQRRPQRTNKTKSDRAASGHNGLNRSRRPRASWTSGRRSRRRTRHVAPSAPTPRTLPRWRPPRLGQARPRRAAAAPWLGFGFGLGLGSGIGFGLGRALGLGLGMGLGWTSSSSTAGVCLVSLLSRCTAAAP